MMIGVQDVLEVALDDTTLSTQVLDDRFTTADQSILTGLECLRAVRKAGIRVTGEVRSALSDLLSDVMAWVSDRRRGEEKRCRKSDEERREIHHLDGYLEASG
jgi:hypothetical protein